MAALVEGEDPLLLVGDDAPLLQPRDDPLERILEVGPVIRSAPRPALMAAPLQMFEIGP